MVTVEEKLTSILEKLPNYYNIEDSCNNYKFFKSMAGSYSKLANQIVSLKEDIQISTATGNSLDGIGSLFNLNRITGETDDEYRGRILGYWQSIIGGGTEDSLKKAIGNVLSISDSDVDVEQIRTLVIKLIVYIDEDVNLTLLDSVSNTIQNTKAAGVRVLDSEYKSQGSIFRVNLSGANGEDLIL